MNDTVVASNVVFWRVAKEERLLRMPHCERRQQLQGFNRPDHTCFWTAQLVKRLGKLRWPISFRFVLEACAVRPSGRTVQPWQVGVFGILQPEANQPTEPPCVQPD